MRIGFDATAMFGPASKNRGIGNYSISLFKTLIEADKENEYFLFNCMDGTEFAQYFSEPQPNFHETVLYAGRRYEFVQQEFSELYGEAVRTFVKDNDLDVFIITSPFEFEVSVYEKEWFGDVKLYAIVYDIIPYVMKSRYLGDKRTMDLYMARVEMLRICDKLLAISESAKDDLIKHLGFKDETVDVILGAYDKHFKEIEISAEEKDALYTKFGLRDGYIMCTGGDDDRKNIAGLIESYSDMPKELRERHQLVIVCKLGKQSEERYNALAAKLGVGESLVLTNFVSTEDLIKLYNLAHLMAFPSKYEGFGLPIVEAWACGTPVLTSNNSSLGEVAGDGAVIVDPFSRESVTKGLVHALTEADLPAMLEIGKKRLEALFNWDYVASLTHGFLMKAGVKERADLETVGKEKIAMFTPLPPLKSGISDYSVDILRELSEYFDIDVYTDDGYKPSVEPPLPENITVCNHKSFAGSVNEYKDVIYQVGNSKFHIYMYDYIEKYSGTVVLHDYSMNGVSWFIRTSGMKKIYKKMVQADYPERMVDEIIRSGAPADAPMNGIVVNPASRIIVHDMYGKKRLLRTNFGKNVYVIPLYAKKESNPDNLTLRQKYGYKADDKLISAFGIISESKRIVPLIKAFASEAASDPKLKLLLVGEMQKNMASQINLAIRESGCADRIVITGFTTLSEFIEYMEMTDLCFNLRYPYGGESSGSLARILIKGKPVVVNRVGSFDSVPDDACIKLKNVADMGEQEEIDSISEVISAFASTPEVYKNISERAREYAESELEIGMVVKRYRDVINAPIKSGITRDTADKIFDLLANGGYTNTEKAALAHTIAYAKETKIDPQIR